MTDHDDGCLIFDGQKCSCRTGNNDYFKREIARVLHDHLPTAPLAKPAPPEMITIDLALFRELMACSFQFALTHPGSATALTVIRNVRAYWLYFPEHWREQWQYDIRRALSVNDEWLSILELSVKMSEPDGGVTN